MGSDDAYPQTFFYSFQKAFDEGEIVRLHLLRGTWQLVSNEDYWWMLDLISPKATSVVKDG